MHLTFSHEKLLSRLHKLLSLVQSPQWWERGPFPSEPLCQQPGQLPSQPQSRSRHQLTSGVPGPRGDAWQQSCRIWQRGVCGIVCELLASICVHVIVSIQASSKLLPNLLGQWCVYLEVTIFDLHVVVLGPFSMHCSEGLHPSDVMYCTCFVG